MQELLSKTSPASTECLLYFLRNFRPNGGPSPTYEAILLEFLARVDQRVVKRTGGIERERRTEIRQDLQLWFIEAIATGNDGLDVFEFAFNLAIKGKVIDAIRRYQTRDAVEVAASAFVGDEEGDEGAARTCSLPGPASTNGDRRKHSSNCRKHSSSLPTRSDERWWQPSSLVSIRMKPARCWASPRGACDNYSRVPARGWRP